jgi:GNAT superfamily N-acetyltransferase
MPRTAGNGETLAQPGPSGAGDRPRPVPARGHGPPPAPAGVAPRPGSVTEVASEIRLASTADSGPLLDLLDQLGYPSTPRRLVAQLASASGGGGAVLVAVDGDSVSGFASYQIVYFFEDGAPRCRLTAIAVDEAMRRTGVGQRLVAEVERRARAAACTELEVMSAHRPERAAAHAFYPASGFVDGSRDCGFYTKVLR